MPNEVRDTPQVIDNLHQLAEELLDRIADDSADGRTAVVSIIDAAKKKYNKPIESLILGWVYWYSRTRGPEVDHVIKEMEALKDSYTRLQEFKALVEKGEWKESSFNYYLFMGLINSVPGYKPIGEELTLKTMMRVKELLIYKMDGFFATYNANLKLIKIREIDRAATTLSIQKSVDNVLIFATLKAAKDSLPDNNAKIHFSLTLKNNIWECSWIDATGKIYKLAPGDELISLLVDQGVQDLAKLNAVHLKKLKNECVKARDLFLEKVQLLINPKDAASHAEINNESLIAKGVTATFILRGKPNHYTLSWISTLGKVNEVSLAAYPQLRQWLNAQPALGEEQMSQLKVYLLNVNTAKTITGMESFKKELQAKLAPGSASSSSTPLKTKRLDLSLFAEVAKCLGARQAKPAIAFPDLTDMDEPESPKQDIFPTEVLPPEAPAASLKSSEAFIAVSQLFSHRPRSRNGSKSVEESSSTNQPIV